MIFITLGSQKFQFNRLLEKLDEMVGSGVISDEIFAQIGYSDYKPLKYEYTNFLDRDEFIKRMNQANIVITHGGTGAIVSAVKKGKKTIAVPRLAKYGEHVDDHQLQIIKQFDDLGLICACEDVAFLEKSINIVKHTHYKSYRSNTKRIIESIDNYLESI